MRLTWYMPRLASAGCGMSRRARGIACTLRRRGHDVRYVVPLDAADVPGDVLDGVPVRRIELPNARQAHWSLQALARRRRAEAAAAAVNGDADAVLTCQPEFALAYAERNGAAPVLVVACCSQLLYEPIERVEDARRPGWRRVPFALNRVLLQRGERLGLEAAAAVAFDSRMTCELVRQRYELPEPRCHVVSPTVDVGRFRPLPAGERRRLRESLRLPAEGFIPCWAGRMDDRKNVELLIDAVGLARHHVDALLLIGDGPQRARLEAQARRQRLSDKVRFVGMQSDVASYLQASDVFVLPSLVESFGIALIESLACGLPCIALHNNEAGVRSGAAESIVAGVTGWLLSEATPRELADRLIEAADDPHMRREMGDAARERAVRDFALGRDARQMERIVERVLTEI